MKRMTVLIFTIFLSFNVFSQYGGNQTYVFLDLPNSARAVALGGENLSIKDVNSIFNNPSLLDSSMSNYLTISYVNYFAGIKWGYSSYSFSGGKYGNFAVAMQYINYGKFLSANENGDITGKFSAADYTLSLLWSYKLDSAFSIGAILKPIYSSYESYSSFGIALDMGLNYLSSNKLFSAAIVVRNFGTQLKTYIPQQKEKLPFEISIGLSEKLSHAPFRLFMVLHHIDKPDLSYIVPQTDNTTNISSTTNTQNKIGKIADIGLRHFIFGIEIIPAKHFYIDLGFNYQRRQELKFANHPGLAGFSTGFGLKIKKFTFNYGISKFNSAGSMQNFTISLNLSQLNQIF